MSDTLSVTIKTRVAPAVKIGFRIMGKKTTMKAAHHQRQAFREYLNKPEHATLLNPAPILAKSKKTS